MKIVRVRPVTGTTLAESKDEAAEMRDRDILPALERGETVTIDFAGVETATQSYVHALIATAIRQHGESAFHLLVFKNCSEGVQHIVRTVFEYTLLSKREAETNGAQQ